MDYVEVVKQHWFEALDGNRQLATNTFNMITQMYAEHQRHYHTMQHVAEMLSNLDRLFPKESKQKEIVAAIVLHDVVYDPRAHDNEQKSVDFAYVILEDSELDCTLVGQLILATQHGKSKPQTRRERVVVDLDLWILAADSARYSQYEQQIREEYSFVSVQQYRAGRAGVLKQFLNEPYLTEEMQGLTAQARINVNRAIAALQ